VSTSSITVNGVDTTAIAALREKLLSNPAEGATHWRAQVVWQGGFLNAIHIRDLPVSYADEPLALGGTNTAPNPVEQLLGALGSCLAIGYTANASLRGIEIKELRVELEGEIDLPVFLGLHEGHAGYSGINVKVHLKADAPQEALEEIHRHVLSTSPVGQTIEKAIPLQATLLSE
jgi:uncharacterized OsmC-like protein